MPAIDLGTFSNGMPHVIVDSRHYEVYRGLGRGRRVFADRQVVFDSNKAHWCISRIGDCAIAVGSFGPGWCYDEVGRSRRADELAARRRWLETAQAEDHRTAIDAAIVTVRFGAIAERLIWFVHTQVIRFGSSRLRLPDRLLGRVCYGADETRPWPRHWRQTVLAALRGLTYLHVAVWDGFAPLPFGDETAFVLHVGDLRGEQDGQCPPECLMHGRTLHSHIVINIGPGFLGVLEQCVRQVENGIRQYRFPIRCPKSAGPSLNQIGESGCLRTVFLPGLIGSPAACAAFTSSQLNMIQALGRELTRRAEKGSETSSPKENANGCLVPSFNGRGTLPCPMLTGGVNWIGFNGNGKRRGQGYRMRTRGGWLAKGGYSFDDLELFIRDLAALACNLGIKPIGIFTTGFFDLASLQQLLDSPGGYADLDLLHLRVYAPHDWLTRWCQVFNWTEEPPSAVTDSFGLGNRVATELRRRRMTRKALAELLKINASFLTKLLNGLKRWPSHFAKMAADWLLDAPRDVTAQQKGDFPGGPVNCGGVAKQNEALNSGPLSIRVEPMAAIQRQPFDPSAYPVSWGAVRVENAELNAETSLVRDEAISALRRGWSVVPQLAGAKHPTVKWKPFQNELPTEANWARWIHVWPDCGIAVILGPISDLFVIDVDGEEAHRVLLDRMGTEPPAPKALSGSRKPCRYHLFFLHPPVPTKPKSTPWHPQLEFRGKNGLIVLPPSLHKSGNRYAWESGRSPNEIALSAAPDAVIAALRPVEPVTTYAGSVNIDAVECAPSTRYFLDGNLANAPRWNQNLFNAACDLSGRGVPLNQAEPHLLAGARPWNTDEEANAKRTIASAYSQKRTPRRI
jgi:Bifunctional DNA primase/polymerase, N-terminal